ncbi:MAG: single-stranded DNA-binding protein [Phycisphaerales bacterium]|nr:MAG: single-stranded DNA-binding protein [Phycisphaerales bacterium]
MANFNKVILLGNLTRDPQLRYLPSNTAVCDFGLAVNRKYRGQDGEMKDETCFVDVDVFGKQAETISQYMSKGRPLLVEGRLRFRQWTTEDGQKRSKLSVVAEGFQFLGGRGEEGAAPARAAAPRGARNEAAVEDEPLPPADDDVPF